MSIQTSASSLKSRKCVSNAAAFMQNTLNVCKFIHHQETDTEFNAKDRDRPEMRSKNNYSALTTK